jgi:histidine triad (HIT) family protein
MRFIPRQRTVERPPCPFCEIVAGRGPATILRTRRDVITIVPIGPVVEGHALIIPHHHFARPEHNLAASENAVGYAIEWASTQREDYNLIINVGKNAGQTVPHVHWHYVPRRENDHVAMPWDHPADR